MLNYESYLADLDIWLRQAITSKGEEYYEYVFLYGDDILVVSEHPRECLLEIDKYFSMKPESIGPPTIYLGGKLTKVTLNNGVEAWSFSSSQYV